MKLPKISLLFYFILYSSYYKSLLINEKNPESWLNLHKLFIEIKKYEEAEEW